jgi:hypothetical protein
MKQAQLLYEPLLHTNIPEDDMNLADISKLGIKNPFKQRYDNFIGGKFVAPRARRLF